MSDSGIGAALGVVAVVAFATQFIVGAIAVIAFGVYGAEWVMGSGHAVTAVVGTVVGGVIVYGVARQSATSPAR